MSKKANPTLIGIFVLGAVLLLLSLVLLLGGGKLFRETQQAVAYFDGTVRGLQVGSKVVFQGVPIGAVTDIRLVVDTEAMELSVPVVMELDQTMLDFIGDRGGAAESYARIRTMIGRGLRAQLVIDSLVTGQVLIELGFHPESSETYRAPPEIEMLEIPTIPSDLQVMMDKAEELVGRVEELPIEELIETGVRAVAALDRLLSSPEVESIVTGIDDLVNAEETQQLTASLKGTLEKLDATLDDASGFLSHADAQLEPLTEDISETLQKADSTLDEARSLLTDLRAMTSADSELHFNANATLREMESAMRSLRVFLDYLDRHPEALLRGKKTQ